MYDLIDQRQISRQKIQFTKLLYLRPKDLMKGQVRRFSSVTVDSEECQPHRCSILVKMVMLKDLFR